MLWEIAGIQGSIQPILQQVSNAAQHIFVTLPRSSLQAWEWLYECGGSIWATGKETWWDCCSSRPGLEPQAAARCWGQRPWRTTGWSWWTLVCLLNCTTWEWLFLLCFFLPCFSLFAILFVKDASSVLWFWWDLNLFFLGCSFCCFYLL